MPTIRLPGREAVPVYQLYPYPAPYVRLLPDTPTPSLRMPLGDRCALAPNAIPDCPANRATPTARLIVLPGSTCGSMVSAVAAAIPCRAIESVCCSCEPRLLICACWFCIDCDTDVESVLS